MTHDVSVQNLSEENTIEGRFIRPDYDGYCIRNVIPTIASLFEIEAGTTLPQAVFRNTSTNIENVVLILIDGLGYHTWKKNTSEHQLLSAIEQGGTVTPLTTVVPSETTAAITSLHTGTAPAAHGQFGWDLFINKKNEIIQPLPFSIKGTNADATSVTTPEEIFGAVSVYEDFCRASVSVHLFGKAHEVTGPYTAKLLSPANRHSTENVGKIAHDIRETLEDSNGETFCYGYVSETDAAIHHAGPRSDLYQNQLRMVLDAFSREFLKLDSSVTKDTLVLVTSDHGGINTLPGYIDLLDYDVIADNTLTSQDGDRIPPTGWPRLAHLHLNEGSEELVSSFLEKEFEAFVTTKSEAVNRDLFGPNLTETGRRQMGDVIISHPEKLTWYADESGWGSHTGFHGGMTKQEMVVPFAAIEASELSYHLENWPC